MHHTKLNCHWGLIRVLRNVIDLNLGYIDFWNWHRHHVERVKSNADFTAGRAVDRALKLPHERIYDDGLVALLVVVP